MDGFDEFCESKGIVKSKELFKEYLVSTADPEEFDDNWADFLSALLAQKRKESGHKTSDLLFLEEAAEILGIRQEDRRSSKRLSHVLANEYKIKPFCTHPRSRLFVNKKEVMNYDPSIRNL